MGLQELLTASTETNMQTASRVMGPTVLLLAALCLSMYRDPTNDYARPRRKGTP